MSESIATDLCRVVLRAPGSVAEVALPVAVTIGDLLPTLVNISGASELGSPDYEHGWVLQRLGEAPFDEESTPAGVGLREGDTVYLRKAEKQLPTFHFDDLIDGIATGMKDRPDRWQPEMTRWTFLVGTVILLALGLLVAWTGPPLLRCQTLALSAVVLLFGGALCSRSAGDHVAGTLLGMCAMPYAAMAGLLMPTAPGEPSLATPNLLSACAAAAIAAMGAIVGVGNVPAPFGGLGLAGAGGVIGGLLVELGGLPAAGAAAVLVVVAFTLSSFAPVMGFRLARMRLPLLPTSAEDIGEDVEPLPGPGVIASTVVADRYITAMFAAAGATAAGCTVVLVRAGDWAAQATALSAALVLLLRSRAVNSAWQRMSMLLPFASTVVLLVWYHTSHTNWQNRLGTVLPLVGMAALAVVLSLAMPGRRIHPVWGRVADIVEWIVAIAMFPLALAVLGVYGFARALGG